MFLIFPLRAADRTLPSPPIYDVALFLISFGTACYLAWNATNAVEEGWEYFSPAHAQYAAIMLWVLLIEGVRRAGGMALTINRLSCSRSTRWSPSRCPAHFQGAQYTILDIAQYYAFSSESAFGIPMRAFGKLVIGFVIFGIVLQHTGAGRFLHQLRVRAHGTCPGRGRRSRSSPRACSAP